MAINVTLLSEIGLFLCKKCDDLESNVIDSDVGVQTSTDAALLVNGLMAQVARSRPLEYFVSERMVLSVWFGLKQITSTSETRKSISAKCINRQNSINWKCRIVLASIGLRRIWLSQFWKKPNRLLQTLVMS